MKYNSRSLAHDLSIVECRFAQDKDGELQNSREDGTKWKSLIWTAQCQNVVRTKQLIDKV